MKNTMTLLVAAACLGMATAETMGPEVPFPAENVGVCSWSWATNMTTILEQMDTMGVKCMQLSLVPWVKPLYGIEYDASLRETFGKGESGDVFLAISNRIAKGEISVLSTMISFPFDRWGSYQAISNSNGIVCNIATNDAVGEAVSAEDPLGLAAWTVCSNLVDQAAAMTGETAGEKCEAALRAQGFPKTAAGRLADTQLYGGFRGWAEDHELDPDGLVHKSGVILASAYGASAVADPADVRMAVTNLTVSTGGRMEFEIVIEGYDPAMIDENLLKAALGVEGSTELVSGTFSPDALDFEFGEVTGGRLPALVVPRESAPDRFFIRMTAE